jgi:hypothetical protein
MHRTLSTLFSQLIGGLKLVHRRFANVKVVAATDAGTDATRRNLLLGPRFLSATGLGLLIDTGHADAAPIENFVIIPSVGQLATAKIDLQTAVCYCLGCSQPGDGGGGFFSWQGNWGGQSDGLIIVHSEDPKRQSGAWVRENPNSEVNVRWFGAVGNGVTDDTKAFALALNYLTSFGIDIAQPWSPSRPSLYIPGGVYRVGPLPVLLNTQNLKLRGDGSSATKILFVPDPTNPEAGLFDLGQFSQDPVDNWSGSAQGFDLSDIYISCEADRGSERSRQGTGFAIRDNGCGALYIRRTHFWGFKYAILGTYGSDFSRVIDCKFNYNEVGIYLGPGSQQVSLARNTFSRNHIAIIMDAVPQGEISSSYFMDQYQFDIVLEYTGRDATRFGVNLVQKLYNGMFSVKDCWFETGTLDAGDFSQLRAHIWSTPEKSQFRSDGPSGVSVLRSFVVSGTKNMRKAGQTFFWLCESGAYNRISDICVWGSYIDDVVNAGSVSRIEVEIVRFVPT